MIRKIFQAKENAWVDEIQGEIFHNFPVGVFGFRKSPGLVMKNCRIECILAAGGSGWLFVSFRLFHVFDAFPVLFPLGTGSVFNWLAFDHLHPASTPDF